MVKIIGICGSPRRKSSYAALREALDGALETVTTLVTAAIITVGALRL